MDINLDKVAKIVRMVDSIYDAREENRILDDEYVDELINTALMISAVKCSEAELAAIKRDIAWKYKIYETPGESIVLDYEQGKWYDEIKDSIEPKFWSRYRNYLVDDKKFSPNIVSTLGNDTLDVKLMNYIGNPDAEQPFLKRGLIIGDVQSGKTSTYIGFMCKAADAGYRVFILLTGTIESLRKQTQERVEEGFIGIDMSKDDNNRVGVGMDNKPIISTAMTSRVSDFVANADKIAVSLNSHDAVVFVIKKNTTVLRKLIDWLIKLNADPVTKKINLPMLLIDDEADNASVNTSIDKEDPTKINKLIRELVNVFTKSNYVGFTATPFANVFIDPVTTEEMENHDLFPEDFIVALPTPSNYIGANEIFSPSGKYYSQLKFITDAGAQKEDGWPFYFKHDKTWDDELPGSLTDAIYTFYIANAIRDLRGDIKSDRSMLVNISRFIIAQQNIKTKIETIHKNAYRAIKYNLNHDFDKSMKDPILDKVYKTWEEHYSNCEFSWDEIVDALFKSIEDIQIKVVNSSKKSEKLEYSENTSLRVIAIGGLALSRGLTLEGLLVSYFFRNTATYDVLMQMGRWFGYRKGYEDLFRIWIHKESAEWYAEIAEATEQLKIDMGVMRDKELKPKNFGIRVRNNSAKLSITARNKMRNSLDEYEYTSYFGGIVETPYLSADAADHIKNYDEIMNLLSVYLKEGNELVQMEGSGKHYVMKNVSKFNIIGLLKNMKFSKYSTDFDTNQITEFLADCHDDSIETWDIAFMDGAKREDAKTIELEPENHVYLVNRDNCEIVADKSYLKIGQRGKLGGPNDGLIGIEACNGKSAEDIIEEAKALYRDYYNRNTEDGLEFSGKAYPSRTWFTFVKDRKPLLIVYLMNLTSNPDKSKSDVMEEFKKELGNTPVVALAMGLPATDNSEIVNRNRYKANKIYNWFEQGEILREGEEE